MAYKVWQLQKIKPHLLRCTKDYPQKLRHTQSAGAAMGRYKVRYTSIRAKQPGIRTAMKKMKRKMGSKMFQLYSQRFPER